MFCERTLPCVSPPVLNAAACEGLVAPSEVFSIFPGPDTVQPFTDPQVLNGPVSKFPLVSRLGGVGVGMGVGVGVGVGVSVGVGVGVGVVGVGVGVTVAVGVGLDETGTMDTVSITGSALALPRPILVNWSVAVARSAVNK